VENFLAWLQTQLANQILVAVGAALLTYVIARYFVARGLIHVTKLTRNQWDDILVKHMRPFRLAWVAPLLVVFYFADLWGENEQFVSSASLFLVLWLVVFTLNSILTAINLIYESRTTYTGLSIQGYLDIGKLLFLVVGIILSASLFTGQSPVLLLTSIGAASAVLLLIFQDTILDLVASVKIAVNDLIKEGDWIEVPGYDADGEVINMNLNTIRIQNWDKTFTVIPTNKLNETSYKNWRGMSQSGARRIKRALNIDMQSIHFCTPYEIEYLKSLDLLKNFDKKHDEVTGIQNQTDQPQQNRKLTNVGAFISYVDSYLRQRDDVIKDATILVYQLDPGPFGLPVEIYCFTNVIEWEAYELVQVSIFDHVLASLPEFGLRVLQYPAAPKI
jgi:miniconductance mechanosensitive channel